uniref:Nodulin MtN21 family protein n=1 Tax=Solanum tuberosum TaxID=4113 RepID=M1E0Q7_SOLTU
MTFYKGPVVKQYSPSFLHLATSPHLFIFISTHENWVLGCFLFASASFALVIWNIIQVGTSKKHPHVMKITCLYTLFGTIQSALLALLMEKDLRVWKLKLDMELLVIVLTGPSYALFFKPVGVPFASTCGCVLFAATFHYGSMLSACICGLGYYTTLWGQLKEDETMKNKKGNVITSDERVPLLQEQQEEDSQV